MTDVPQRGASQMRTRVKGWIKSLFDIAVIVVVVIAAKSAIAEPYYVPSGSMEPTLQIGDELLATKFNYGYSSASLPVFINFPPTRRLFGALPQRGDVVVFRWPGNRSQIWVKRVIGLPGDRIALQNGRLWINGTPVGLKQDGIGWSESENGGREAARRFIETLPGGRQHTIFEAPGVGMLDNMPEITVPPGHLFVMGDNRDDSADSRVPLDAGGVGMLPISNLVGRVVALVGSWNMAAAKNQPVWDWASDLRLSRFFTEVH